MAVGLIGPAWPTGLLLLPPGLHPAPASKATSIQGLFLSSGSMITYQSGISLVKTIGLGIILLTCIAAEMLS